MNLRFVLRMVRRESRSTLRRFGIHVGAIAIGVAALVAINSFRDDITASVHQQARVLLGADLEVSSRDTFPDTVQALLDSTAHAGVPVAYVTEFGSMALAAPSGKTRLVEVRAIAGGFPFYGAIHTEPAGEWMRFRDGPRALVDPSALVELDAAVGDTLHVGDVAFTIAGTVRDYPGDVGLRSALGPRVFIPAAYLEATHLLQRGSRANRAAYLAFPSTAALDGFLSREQGRLRTETTRYSTADRRERSLTDSLDVLSRYLGLVGLAALLLGGVGVASAVRVFVDERLESAATLRCLGAAQRSVFAIYASLAALLGAIGAVVGAALGVGVQALLPHVLGDFVPIDVATTLHGATIGTGIGIGIGVAVLFAFLPLLRIRNVPPLRALRRDAESARDRWRWAAYGALAAGVIGLSVWQAPDVRTATGFAGAIGATALVLWAASVGAIRLARALFPSRASFTMRQGIANLFRPRNQTVAVILALGFGLFLVATLYVVQTNILDRLTLQAGTNRPNLAVFDVQPDQLSGIERILARQRLPRLDVVPIVPARIAALNGVSVDALRQSEKWRHERWALTREYRNTYRDTLVSSERLVKGSWWAGSRADTSALPRISIEQGIANDLGLDVGSEVTWDVQGVRIRTVVASIRTVNWARFEPNFFVVFAPGSLEGAPRTFALLTHAPNADASGAFQTAVVRAYPNVSALDLLLVQQTLDAVFGKVTLAVRFMALFSIAAGILILAGAVVTSRAQRLREAVLLKTLGATSRQVRRIVRTEYAALGVLAGVVGAGLALAGGWAATHFLLHLGFRPPIGALLLFAAATGVLTTVVGTVAGRDALRRPPLDALRRLAE